MYSKRVPAQWCLLQKDNIWQSFGEQNEEKSKEGGVETEIMLDEKDREENNHAGYFYHYR